MTPKRRYAKGYHVKKTVYSRTGYLGVTPHSRKGFVAQLAGKYIGWFNNPEDAAACYNKAAFARYGSDAFQNKIQTNESK